MINSVEISNFRSIQKDTIKFDTPITIVIGANGTGKTNLMLALKFISSCVSDSPVRAIQKSGGLDKVFSIRDRRAKKCSFKINIIFSEEPDEYYKDSFVYEEAEYFFELKFDDLTKRLIVSEEYLKARLKGGLLFDEIYSRKKVGDKLTISGLLGDGSTASRIPLHENLNYLYISVYPRSFESQGSKYNWFLENLRSSLAGISGYNFDPHALRRSSDLLSPIELGYDGRGFSSLIYRVINKKGILWKKNYRRKGMSTHHIEESLKGIYEDILPFLHSFSSDEAIDTTTVELKFKEEQHLGTTKTFSAAHLSDGTLKFLAVIMAIITLPDNHLLYLEEVENYLNPKAIRRIIDFMRNQSESNGKKFILTTHSETVLNQMQAKEVLVSRRIKFGTKYSKFRQMKNIESAIDESGIALGTYWGKGGLDDF